MVLNRLKKLRYNSNVMFIDAFKQDINFILGKITRALIMQLRGLSNLDVISIISYLTVET